MISRPIFRNFNYISISEILTYKPICVFACEKYHQSPTCTPGVLQHHLLLLDHPLTSHCLLSTVPSLYTVGAGWIYWTCLGQYRDLRPSYFGFESVLPMFSSHVPFFLVLPECRLEDLSQPCCNVWATQGWRPTPSSVGHPICIVSDLVQKTEPRRNYAAARVRAKPWRRC